MKRQELRVGCRGELEFQFWECWEPDPRNPQGPERHWFRALNGMEAPTFEEMLDKMSGKFVFTPIPPPAVPEPWERRTARQVRIKEKGKYKDVLINIIERYTCENGTLTGVTVRGPNGLVTSSCDEMLELLGIAEPPAVAGGAGSERQLTAQEGELSVLSSQSSVMAARQTEPEFAVSQDGKLVANCANGDSPSTERQPELLSPEPVCSDEAQRPLGTAQAGRGAWRIPADHENREDPNLDAVSDREYRLRSQEFEREHPWLWGDTKRFGPEDHRPISELKLVWFAEETKALYPEMYAAALDPKKYREYMEKNDYDMPIPPPEKSEGGDAVAADSPRCQFIKSDGECCGSPALKRKRLCHFHSKTTDGYKRRSRRSEGASRGRTEGKTCRLEVPVLEDDLAIQMAVTNICRHLANDTIEPKRAATLLYGLQVASVAVRKTTQKRHESKA